MGTGMAARAIAAEEAAGGNGRGIRAIGQAGGGRGAGGRGSGGAGSQALVPANNGGGQASLLDLFNTPHSFGGASGGVTGVTNQMRRLKM